MRADMLTIWTATDLGLYFAKFFEKFRWYFRIYFIYEISEIRHLFGEINSVLNHRKILCKICKHLAEISRVWPCFCNKT